MGLLISRFRRQKTTIEILEGIDKDIASLQKYRRKNQENQKKFIASLILYSIILYIIAAVVFIFLYFPAKWKDRIIHSIPLLIFPFLVWLLKKLLHWYYVKRTSDTDSALVELREKKKQMLEDVMENETYKKAREILEKFDPARYRQLEKPETSPKSATPSVAQTRLPTPRSVQAVQQARPQTMAPTPPQFRPRSPMNMSNIQRTPIQGQQQMQPMMTPAQNGSQMWMRYERPPGPPLPRSLLPRERTTFDKTVDYLFGDGPQNRYALICRQCHSHNGMALKEEFEYISFRCCYCFTFNSARKQKPHAPKLEFPTPVLQRKIIPNNKKDSSEEDEDGESEEETSSSTPDSTTASADNKTDKKTHIIPQPTPKTLPDNLVQRKNIPKNVGNTQPAVNGDSVSAKSDLKASGEKTAVKSTSL